MSVKLVIAELIINEIMVSVSLRYLAVQSGFPRDGIPRR